MLSPIDLGFTRKNEHQVNGLISNLKTIVKSMYFNDNFEKTSFFLANKNKKAIIQGNKDN